MNWLILISASIIFVMITFALHYSFFKQYPTIFKPFPKLWSKQEWLVAIPYSIATIVFTLTVVHSDKILSLRNISVYQQDQVRISASMTIVVTLVLLFLSSLMSSSLLAFSKNHNKKALMTKLCVCAGIFLTIATVGVYMAININNSIFNGLTA